MYLPCSNTKLLKVSPVAVSGGNHHKKNLGEFSHSLQDAKVWSRNGILGPELRMEGFHQEQLLKRVKRDPWLIEEPSDNSF